MARRWSRNRWIAITIVALVAIAGAGYAAFAAFAGGGPAAVSLSPGVDSACTASNPVDVPNGSSASGELDGSWELQTGDSFVGYRVREQLAILPAPSDAVGRTTAVEGGLDVSGLEITKVDVTADLTQLISDKSMRDERIRTIGLETDSFPEATFTLTEPITFEAQPAESETIVAGAMGELSLHGVANQLCVPVQATLTGDGIQVLGSVGVVFADYEMQAPNFGFVTTENHGTIEFQLDFARS
jgi:polyisoprenoid-binding protein YceI